MMVWGDRSDSRAKQQLGWCMSYYHNGTPCIDPHPPPPPAELLVHRGRGIFPPGQLDSWHLLTLLSGKGTDESV